MKVRLKQQGGFIGTNMEFEIDGRLLTEMDVEIVKKFIQNRLERAVIPNTETPDLMNFMIEISDLGIKQSVDFTEADIGQELGQVMNKIQQRAIEEIKINPLSSNDDSEE